MPRYRMSKLANALFLFELDRRLRAAGSPVMAVGCHPGLAGTDLGRHAGPLRVMTVLVKSDLQHARQGRLADAAGGHRAGDAGRLLWTDRHRRNARPLGRGLGARPGRSIPQGRAPALGHVGGDDRHRPRPAAGRLTRAFAGAAAAWSRRWPRRRSAGRSRHSSVALLRCRRNGFLEHRRHDRRANRRERRERRSARQAARAVARGGKISASAAPCRPMAAAAQREGHGRQRQARADPTAGRRRRRARASRRTRGHSRGRPGRRDRRARPPATSAINVPAWAVTTAAATRPRRPARRRTWRDRRIWVAVAARRAGDDAGRCIA